MLQPKKPRRPEGQPLNEHLANEGLARFIRANTRLLPVPYAPEIQLQLADEATELWHRTEEELAEIGLPPPFWAFAWAGGQALARYVLDHKDRFAGKFVLDFAAGSGLVAIAAAKAGAAPVEASDIDCFALSAIGLNADANGVRIVPLDGDLVGRDAGWDVVLAGDVSYERDMAERVTAWLEGLARRGADVLIGDPGRTYLARDRLEAVAEYQVPVTRELEDLEIKRSQVWQFKPASR
jgi:predicted nicotinamide N-methyase